ncbi:(2Fe-2S)-binding protein [Paenibacillus sp. 481]|uniref:(2Fe-2S)-binding protein n=1 Tax=Paenibacillus sp. 481 TaxID=2835869 RepID=UPI001E32B49B|nr:(2Fe-2S)-binding protein [Paenibacillus sp. 481]UHA73403.1 (2Fe-2S)-binding protein [Paenibacillus sp. 481]
MNKSNLQLSLFEPEEVNILTEHFRLTLHASRDSRLSIPAVDLLDTAKCQEYLEAAKTIFQCSNAAASLSQLSKRYAYLTMASGLYAMTMFNKGLDYSIENCHIESVDEDKSWLPEVCLSDWRVTEPTGGDRYIWREQMIQRIFAGNMAEVWNSVSKVAKVPTSILWENAAISVYWLYERRMLEGASDQQKARIQEDFQYLVQEAPAHLFGERENPMKKYNSPKCTTSYSDTPIRVRKTCCFLYKISDDHDYCLTCPKLK